MNSPVSIPADYLSLGLKSGYNPPSPDDLRLWIVALPGQGKSTFLASIPDTLILDFEQGCRAIPGSRSCYVPIRNADHFDQVMTKLLEDGKNNRRKFKRIVFDTVDQYLTMFADVISREKGVETIAEFGSKGAGYNLLANRCWAPVEALRASGYIWAMTGHIKQETVTLPGTNQEITKERPSAYSSFTSRIVGGADLFGTLTSTHVEKQVMKKVTTNGSTFEVPSGQTFIEHHYYLNIASLESREAKARGVPSIKTKIELPLYDGWKVFCDEYNNAIERSKEDLKQKGIV
jgi:hypothetical protein